MLQELIERVSASAREEGLDPFQAEVRRSQQDAALRRNRLPSETEMYLRRHGLATANRVLDQWDFGPVLTETPDGGTTVTAAVDPELGPAVTWHRDSDGLISSQDTLRGEQGILEEWLYDQNDRWDLPLHRAYENRDPEDPDPPAPWHAAAIYPVPPAHPSPRYNILLEVEAAIAAMSSHLGLRIFLEALQTRAIYTSPEEAVETFEEERDELEKLTELIADQALISRIEVQEAREMVEALAHLNWRHVNHYRGEWQHAAITMPPAKDWQAEENWENAQRHKILSMLNRSHHMADRRKAPQPTRDPVKLVANTNRMVCALLLDGETARTLARLNGRRTLVPWHEYLRSEADKIEQYNQLVHSHSAVGRLLNTAPELANIYLSAYAKPGQRTSHPGQIVARLKAHQKLTPAEWRCFQKILRTQGEIKRINPADVRLAARNITAANRPDAPDGAFKAAATAVHLHHRHEKTGRRDTRAPQRHKAWIHALNAFLDPSGDPELRNMRRLADVSDAVAGTIQDGGAWGPGSWENMLKRSENWHRRLFQARFKTTGRGRWRSAVREYDTGDLTVSPLTTGSALTLAGQMMNNCLGTYYEDCRSGRTRIFLVTQKHNSGIRAAVQLVNNGRGWILGQTEGLSEERAPTGTKDLATDLLERYRQASSSPQRKPKA